jgi:hypothetical protein
MSLISGVLLAGKFRTQHELTGMSHEDQRNTLIVEMSSRTNQSGAHFQAMDDATLAGAGAVLVFLRAAKIRTDEHLKTMSDDDRRNTLIVEIGVQTRLPGPVLQGLSNTDLVLLGLGKDGSFIRGVLLAGKFRTHHELNTMSHEDQRNTLIVELSDRTNQSGAHFQAMDDATLAGTGAVLVFLREAKIRSDEHLKTMSDDDRRNTLIVEIGAQTRLPGPVLQGLSNLDLVCVGLGIDPAALVFGEIGRRYNELGGARSWLGLPTSYELDFFEGKVRLFQNGAIYWWPDAGAIELGKISLQYKGLHCFGETNELSDSDEPYVIFGVVPTPPAQPSSVRTRVYEENSGVDAGGTRPDYIELYRGLPYGMALGVVLMENDEGDPDKYLEEINQGVVAAGAAVTTALTAVPAVGPFLALASAALFEEFADDIAKVINDILGTGDDVIEKWVWNVTAKEMVTMARAPRLNFRGIEYHLESKLLSDGEASYKVYLDIQSV